MSVRKKLFLCVGIVILLLIITATGFYLFRFRPYNQEKQQDLIRLASEEYTGIFCSMYPTEHFAEEDFVTYLATPTVKLSASLQNSRDVELYLSSAFASGNSVEKVFLGLDPAQLWSSVNRNSSRWQEALSNHIIAPISAHPEVNFQVLLPAPSLTYWEELGDAKTEELLTTYEALISALSPLSNVTTFFPGGEYWLIANPDNYDGTLCTNEIISQKIFLYTFCDQAFQVTGDTAPLYTEALKSLIAQEATAPEYPDLSEWDVVFFGDSIIGNYEGSYSVPGVLTGLSEARTYNCAQGGIPASHHPDSILSFLSSVDYFIGQDASALPALNGPFADALESYAKDNHENRKLCFVLNFGLNDYFSGHPVFNSEDPYNTTTYGGALKVGIEKLQKAYPEALLLVMTPNFITQFNNGNDILSENGSILTEYVDTAIEIAKEYQIPYLNNYTDLGINETTASVYLADAVHLNETGRFLLGKKIMELLADY